MRLKDITKQIACMHKFIYCINQLSASDFGIGPSRFVRRDNERPVATEQTDQVTNSVPDLAYRVWEVAADLSVQQQLRMDNLRYVQNQLMDGKEDDPEKKTKPAGGGCPDDSKLNKDTYWDEMMETANNNNWHLRDPQERRNTHTKILPLFRERVRENRNYTQQDREGPPTAEGPEFIIKDGGIYYPKFKKSLQQMYKDQQRIRPQQYDPREHATMTLMEAAFVNGATEVSHVSHNKDKNGDDAIRDQVTMVLDPETGKGRMEIRNISKDENYLSTKEAYDVMVKNYDGFIEGHPTEGVFIFTNAPLPTEQVHEILSMVQPEQITYYESTSEPTIPYYAVTEFTGEIDVLTTYTNDTQRHLQIPEFLRKLLGYFAQEKETETVKSSSVREMNLVHLLTDEKNNAALKKLTTPPHEVTYLHDGKENLSETWRRIAEKTLNISSEKSKQLLIEVKKMWKSMSDAGDIISFAVYSGIGIGAALATLEALKQLHFKPSEKSENEGAMLVDKRSETTPLLLEKNKGELDINAGAFELIVHSLLEEKHDKHSVKEIEALKAKNTEVRNISEGILISRLTKFIETLDQQTPQNALIRIEAEEERVVDTLQLLSEVFRKILYDNERHNFEFKTYNLLHSGNRNKEDQLISPEFQKQLIREFSFAVTLWTMIKLETYGECITSLKNALLDLVKLLNTRGYKENRRKEVYDAVTERLSEALTKQEGTRWILLSIIWYLAMIREQGFVVSVNNQKPAKKKKVPQLKRMYQTGIIFAFGS